MIFSEQQSRSLTEKILKLSKADSAVVHISSEDNANLRFANNDITSNGLQKLLNLSITSNFGTRSATVRWNQTDENSLKEAVLRSEQMAKLAPENPEFIAPLAAQNYQKPNASSTATAASKPHDLASWLQEAIDSTRSAKLDGAGFLARKISFDSMATSAGLFVYQPSTVVNFSVTARTREGGGSGWASTQLTDSDGLSLKSTTEQAVNKALQSKKPRAMEAGRYPVILEASAARNLVSLLLASLHRRSSDEKRSFLNQLAEGDPVGQTLFGKQASLFSDPNASAAPGSIYSYDGLASQRIDWITQGKLRNLQCGRFWAKKQQIQAIAHPSNLIMEGDKQPLEKLISQVDKGILITRLWYLRMVQPQTLLYTGLTRDGTFLIENGEVTQAVNNFRFNESPVNVLKNLVASGHPERVLGSEGSMPMYIPPLLVDDFHFSSVSDAV